MPDSPANPDFATHVRATVLSMPAAKLFGFDFSRIEPGLTELTLPYREALSFRPGFFQGAILGSLADFAGASAAATLLPPGWMVSTIDYDVRIVAPAQGEQADRPRSRGEARVHALVHAGRRVRRSRRSRDAVRHGVRDDAQFRSPLALRDASLAAQCGE